MDGGAGRYSSGAGQEYTTASQATHGGVPSGRSTQPFAAQLTQRTKPPPGHQTIASQPPGGMRYSGSGVKRTSLSAGAADSAATG